MARRMVALVLLLVVTGLVSAAVTTQQEMRQAVESLEKNLNTPRQDEHQMTTRQGLENHLMREKLENNQVTTSKVPKNHNMTPQMQKVKEPQEALQQARPYQIDIVRSGSQLSQQEKKMHQNEVVRQVEAPQQASKLQTYKVEAARPQQAEVGHGLRQQTSQSGQERPSSQPQTENVTLQDFKLGFDEAADPRLFWHLGHHPPNCPNHPHPPYPPAPPRCGGVFTGQSALLSPGFPAPYPPLVQCAFSVLPSSPGHACFRVTFAYLAIRWSPNCRHDWIQIDQGPRLCGGLTGDKYYQTHGNLRVEFTSGSAPGPEGSGFRLIVSQVPCHVIDPPSPPIAPPHHPPPPPHHPPHRPPVQPPHHCPPERPIPPIYHPPPIRPPIYHPPHRPEPPIYHPPHRPEPPIYHPPSRPPSHQHPTWWWRWNRILKCEWSGIKHLPPGLCPPHEPPHKPPHVPPHGPPHGPHGPPNKPQFPPSPGPPIGGNCGRVVSTPQFTVRSDDWLPRRSPSGPNRPWSCQLSIFKAAPSACEVHLMLENVQLRCGVEFLEVAGERVCGNQPLRQLSADFWGPESRIIYHNLSGDAPPGNFVIRGYQNFDCSPLILDVTPAKKVAQPSLTTPGPSMEPRQNH